MGDVQKKKSKIGGIESEKGLERDQGGRRRFKSE